MKWFSRQFQFDHPAWMYPNIIERLRGTPARAAHLVEGKTVEQLTLRDTDQWSVQENIGHLLDLEPLWTARFEEILDGAEILREADLTNRLSFLANHNLQSVDDILRGFARERRRMVKLLDSVEPRSIEASSLHPRLMEPMRLIDLAFFVAEHDDHHLVTVSRLLRR
jgi:uncharacterized damage-inducible protein DinB